MHYKELYCIELYHTVLYYCMLRTVLYRYALIIPILYCTVSRTESYCTILYCTVPFCAVLKKIYSKKKSSSLRRFHKQDFFMHLYFKYTHRCFKYQLSLFCMVVNILMFLCIFSYIGLFFRGRFCMKSYWSRKKVLENKVSNW